MNNQDLIRLGVPQGDALKLSYEHMRRLFARGLDREQVEADISNIVANPPAFFADELRAPLARAIYRPAFTPRAELAPWRQWGEGLEAEAVKQMANACALPVAVAGALMPDAHVGYGLPIGGVLATDNAVIPYAVGVDIACRMKLTVYDRKANTLAGQRDRLANIIESETRFGMGCEFKERREHEVMDEDWSVSPVTQRLRDKAWTQLGTSGIGQSLRRIRRVHRGVRRTQAAGAALGLEPGEYLALLTHSGSRGTGAQVCDYYSKRAMARHEQLAEGAQAPRVALARRRRRPGILGRDELDGPLRRGEPRAHPPAHREEARRARDPRHREPSQLRVERDPRRERRRRARSSCIARARRPRAPACSGSSPARWRRPATSCAARVRPSRCTSASHGAGRVMSRTKAMQSFTWSATKKLLAERGVELLSAGLDEVPGVYKDIHAVMAAQTDLVEVLGQFDPKLVKMCPAGDRAED